MDYELTIRARNNRILSRIRKLGFTSLAAFCERYSLSYHSTLALIRLAKPAVGASGHPTLTTVKLCDALEAELEDLFTDRQLQGIRRATVIRHVDEEEMISLDSSEAKMIPASVKGDPSFDERRATIVADELATLPSRIRNVIERRFGLGESGREETLEEIANSFGVGAERIRQIQCKGIRMLKRPERSRRLREAME